MCFGFGQSKSLKIIQIPILNRYGSNLCLCFSMARSYMAVDKQYRSKYCFYSKEEFTQKEKNHLCLKLLFQESNNNKRRQVDFYHSISYTQYNRY